MFILPRSRTARAVAGTLLAAAAATGWLLHGTGDADTPTPIPTQVRVGAWDTVLAGDSELTDATYRQLAAVHPGLDAADADTLGRLAGAVLAADLTGRGRVTWPHYWPPAPTTTTPPPVRCTGVEVLGASPTTFEVHAARGRDRYVKTLVAYAGSCGDLSYTTGSPGVDYVYLRGDVTDAGTRWTPVREWDIPQLEPATSPEELADWQLADLGPCGIVDDDRHRMRTLPAEAFDQMCRAAAEDDVVLVVASAYRTRAEQAELFADAVDHYGSDEEARRWVAYADDQTCESRHCAGTAVSVEPDNAAVSWLQQVVGCVTSTSGGRTLTAGQSCEAGEVPVRRLQRYGFVAPVPRIPGYLEFVLPTGDDTVTAADCSPEAMSADKMVAAIFRCRLARVGVPAVEVERVVAEALVVSRCTSGWNPGMVALDGAFTVEPNPADGRRYTETGLFGLRAELAETGWLRGDATDAAANIHAAASLWLATRGWEQFGCATGTDPGLGAGPVLPQYGGPQIPAWATQY